MIVVFQVGTILFEQDQQVRIVAYYMLGILAYV